MPNPNKKIILAVVLIAAFGCMAAVFYSMGQKASPAQKNVGEMEAKIAALTKEKESTQQISPAVKNRRGQVKLESLLKSAEGIYDESERDRTEGFLWIDRTGQNFIVTLGALNGLETGDELIIFDESNRRVDNVKVELLFDTVAFVKPIKKTSESFSNSYYRVVKEE